ncbi:MAG: hypothetical protein RL341_443 [Pseudomonadota bacterium]
MPPIPAPLALARQIAPALHGLSWAIGGSVLLHRLGLEAAPRDLDIVTTDQDFAPLCAQLAQHLQRIERTPHPRYISQHFARFVSPQNVSVDVMASIAVRGAQGEHTWAFDPATIEQQGGLPWMRAADWLVLYRLFDRPVRVAQLAQYLGSVA